ncbi:MAG: amidohydrolase family protein [Saprospiraceae bacterium]
MKIDAHLHLNQINPKTIRHAIEHGFRLISINTDVPFFPNIEEQEAIILQLKKDFPTTVFHVATFPTTNFWNKKWEQNTIEYLKRRLENEAVGVKIWKNIGMELKDENGHFILQNHSKFDSIYDFLVNNNIPLLAHTGEPLNCWLPLNEMTVKQDRDYFAAHTEYHAALLPEIPHYWKHINARDNILEKHPNLRFVGAHIGSLEWNTDEIAKRLDKFPNLAVDLADRVCHLQHQAVTNWQKVHDFVVKYQDRILYGTDFIDDDFKTQTEKDKWLLEDKWKMHDTFFMTSDKMTAPKVTGSFKGLNLSKDVLNKIYRKNALNWYQLL